jgi:predicted membrane chloride channel (bestrophin family)
MSAPLLSPQASKSDFKAQKDKAFSMTAKAALSWVSPWVLLHSVAATGLAALVYAFYNAVFGSDPPIIGVDSHKVIGIVLGALLCVRISVGVHEVAVATQAIESFNKACRSMVVLSCHLTETLTIQAGAELEKKAVAKFRYELVRLLNLSIFSYHLMLKGEKMTAPPKIMEGKQNEAETLLTTSNPTIMCAKWVSTLLEQQRQANRISDSSTAVMMTKVDDLITAYHLSLAQQLAPGPATLNSFAKLFVLVYVYTACPVIAMKELKDTDTGLGPLIIALANSFFSALFFLGMYEAGKLMESPIKAVIATLPLDDLKFSLSEDLSDLVDDPDDSVPVFLTAP